MFSIILIIYGFIEQNRKKELKYERKTTTRDVMNFTNYHINVLVFHQNHKQAYKLHGNKYTFLLTYPVA